MSEENTVKTDAKWYKTWWGILLLLIFCPFSLSYWILKKTWNKNVKITILSLIWIFVGFWIIVLNRGTHSEKKEEQAVISDIKPSATPIIASLPSPSQLNSQAKVEISIPSYKEVNSFVLDNCQNWTNLVVNEKTNDESLKVLAEKIHKDNFMMNYFIFDDSNPQEIGRFTEWEKYENSKKCQETSCDEPEDLYQWESKHLIGMVWWTYEEIVAGIKTESSKGKGFWNLILYRNNGKQSNFFKLESNYSPQPLEYRQLGTHDAAGKVWNDLLICDSFYDGSSLVQLAKNLHKANPQNHYQFFDDDKYYTKFANSETNYPNIKLTSEEENWIEAHHVGIISTFFYDKLKWQLYLDSAAPSDLQVEAIDLD